MKKKKWNHHIFSILLMTLLITFFLVGCEKSSNTPGYIPPKEGTTVSTTLTVEEKGQYTSKEEVALILWMEEK